MSDFSVLKELGIHLRQLLFDGLKGIKFPTKINNSGSEIPSERAISLDSPAILGAKNGNSSANQADISLYLYQLVPNGSVNNWPAIRTGTGELQYPPLSLDLFYLFTPLRSSPEANLEILGRAMQIFAANPVIHANFLDSLLRPNPPEVRLTINPVTLEELTRIWNAFNQPYRLSVCYKIQVVSIDSIRMPREEPPVTERLLDVHGILPGNGGS